MHHSGILILTQHVSVLCHGDAVKNIVAGIKKLVSSNLYVHVANTTTQQISPCLDFNQDHLELFLKSSTSNINSSTCQTKKRLFSSQVFPFLTKFYSEASHQCRDLNVNILLHNIGFHHNNPVCLQRNINCIIADCTSSVLQNKEVKFCFQNFVKSTYSQKTLSSNVPVVSIGDVFDKTTLKSFNPKNEVVSSKGSIVIGGTYDHIHSGHKVLLSEATLLTDKKLVIGLTDGMMLERKLLSELIEPWENRKRQLTNFLCEISDFNLTKQGVTTDSGQKPYLEIAQITDPVGPAGIDPELECIVLSKETIKGGDYVNDTRRKNGLNTLEVHLIGEGGLVSDDEGSESPTQESKFSSSTMRYQSLGNLRKNPNPRHDSTLTGAYVIGLTGGMASGKSSLAKRLCRLGAVVIDCDKLGHVAYEPGTETFKNVVTRFGSDIVSVSGTIDRKLLADKVFSVDASGKRSNLEDLNAIVWPEIERLARKQISEAIAKSSADDSNKVVCVLDAAVLLEAGWDRFVDEVWICLIPTSEATKRIQERDGRSKEEAEKRINSQMTGKERVNQAHVVLSTLWEPSVTQTQVEKAWKLLEERITSLPTDTNQL